MKTSELIVQNIMKVSSDLLTETKEDVFAQINKILDAKGEEYSSDLNRIENFLVGARRKAITPEEALDGMLEKHLISIDKFIHEIKTGKRRPLAQWQEKFVDVHNYLILLEAMIKARALVEAELVRQSTAKEAQEVIK